LSSAQMRIRVRQRSRRRRQTRPGYHNTHLSPSKPDIAVRRVWTLTGCVILYARDNTDGVKLGAIISCAPIESDNAA
jgi:hypothetical protein